MSSSKYLDKHCLNLKKLILKNLNKEQLIIFHKQESFPFNFYLSKLYYDLFVYNVTRFLYFLPII